jgi:hypothetical protein
MSSFIVGPRTLNVAASGLLKWANKPLSIAGATPSDGDIGLPLPQSLTGKDYKQIIAALLDLNARGTLARYGLKDKPFNAEIEKRKAEIPAAIPLADSDYSDAEFFKSLRCIRYQACEGDLPETDPLYMELSEYIDSIQTVAHIDESTGSKYDKLPWGD